MRAIFKLRTHSQRITTLAFASQAYRHINKAAFARIPLLKPLRQLTALSSWQPTRATMGTDPAAAAAGSKQPIEMPEALPADFDKSQFNQEINIKALKISKRQCQQYMKLFYK
jgi:hypothetical protein